MPAFSELNHVWPSLKTWQYEDGHHLTFEFKTRGYSIYGLLTGGLKNNDLRISIGQYLDSQMDLIYLTYILCIAYKQPLHLVARFAARLGGHLYYACINPLRLDSRSC